MADGHLSEAACLIEQGATYRRRVGLQPSPGHGDPIFAGFKPGAFAVYFGDAPYYHFDLDGRWQRAFANGTHFLKALDGSVQSIDRVREGPSMVLKRSTLSCARASDFDSQVRSMALALIALLETGQLARIEPTAPRATAVAPDELRDFLKTISRWDTAGLVRAARAIRCDLRTNALSASGVLECGCLASHSESKRGVWIGPARLPLFHLAARPKSFKSTLAWSRLSGGGECCKVAPFSSPGATCFDCRKIT